MILKSIYRYTIIKIIFSFPFLSISNLEELSFLQPLFHFGQNIWFQCHCHLIQSYNITFLFLWCFYGPFCKPAMVCSVFYCIPRFRQHFMAVRSRCYHEILRVQPSLYWGTSARFTPITYTCKNNSILTVNFIQLKQLAIIKWVSI